MKTILNFYWFLRTSIFGKEGCEEYQSFRRYCGGRWGRWEVPWRDRVFFKIWLPSSCEHFPPFPLCNSTEPLETEIY